MTPGKLKVHMKTHCKDMFPYKCDLCIENYKKKTQLREHKFKIHGIYEFQCQVGK